MVVVVVVVLVVVVAATLPDDRGRQESGDIRQKFATSRRGPDR